MHSTLDKGKTIIRTLTRHGHQAYFVGGFVRDRLLGIATDDVDITTDATPLRVGELFEKVVLTGEKYGTVTVIVEGTPFEVTTFRTEAGYADMRRPDNVRFDATLEEDLARRDFTVNQLIMDADENILDHHDGLDDLNAKKLRTIGKPTDRFTEDALRMLRAFRFVAKLGFDIDTDTFEAIRTIGENIEHVAIERIRDELVKLFDGNHKRKALLRMRESGFSAHLPHAEAGVARLAKTPLDYDPDAAFATFVLETPEALDAYKFSNRQQKLYRTAFNLHHQTREDGFKPEHLFQFGKDICLFVNTVNRIQGMKDAEADIIAMDASLPIRAVCDLAFKGEDILKETPYKRRSDIGFIIDHLVLEVINRRLPNDRDALRKEAERFAHTLPKENPHE